MFGPKRGHFILIFDNFLKDFFLAIIGLVLLVSAAVSADEVMGEIIASLFLLLSPINKFIAHFTTKYEIDEQNLIIRRGLFNKKTTQIPKSTISTVDVSQSILQQLAGVCKLRIDNAAQGAITESVMAFKKEEALYVKSLLLSERAETVQEEATHADIVKVNAGAFILMGLLQGKIGYFIQMFALVALIIPFAQSIIPMLLTDVERYILESFPVLNAEMSFQTLPIVTGLIAGLFGLCYFIALVWSVISTLFTYYGFTLKSEGNKLLINYGLLKKRSFTLPRHKVCGINIQQSMLMRMFGYYRLDVYAMGYGETVGEDAVQTIFYPFGKRDDVYAVAKKFFPEFDIPSEFTKPQKRAFRYFFFNFWFIAFIIGIIVAVIFQNPYVIAACAMLEAITVGYIVMAYKTTAMHISDETVTFVRGGYAKNMTIVPTSKIESIEKLTTRLKQKKGICHIRLSFFAPTGVATMKVKNMAVVDFVRLENVLKW